MLGVLQSLVGNASTEQKSKGLTAIPPIPVDERGNTASTSATDEGHSESVLSVDNIPLLLDQPPFLVEVKPETDGPPLGLTLSPDDDASYLTIDEVRTSGLIANWNASHPDDMIVQPGYTIISVNGVSVSARAMLGTIQNLQKGLPLRLLIQAAGAREATASREPTSREGSLQSTVMSIDGPPPKQLLEAPLPRQPFEVELELGRADLPLGLAVSIDDDPSYVTIDSISSPGLIEEWNSKHQDGKKVCVGDIITAVGKCTGSGKALLDMMTSIQHFNRGAVIRMTIEQSRKAKRRGSKALRR